MKKLLIFVLVMCTFFIYGCSLGKYVVSESGDEAEILLKNKNKIEGEIIFITDSTIVFAPPEVEITAGVKAALRRPFFYVYKDEIEEIKINGFDGSGWGTSVVLFQVVPVGLLTIAALSFGMDDIGPIFITLIPAGLTSLFFTFSHGETPGWDISKDITEMSLLKIFTRYPMGLSQEDLNKLLAKNGQKEIKKYMASQL